HSTVELVDRLVERGYLCRLRATDDRRQVLVKLTHAGEKFLEGLSLHHFQELQSVGPKFVQVLQSLIESHVGATPAGEDETANQTNKLGHKRKDARHG
ncbi:MAG TPA: hypothetical protein VNT76_19245, partial [Candidatus Binatus sp.]|nr:hypothetical protein [Candidatus Binatus sp.]